MEAPASDAHELAVPFCYGSVAVALPKRANPDAHSHKWTVYVRGPSGEDLSHVVAKVTFGLHPSFAQAQRVCTSPPYEVTETGWGEFDIAITIDLVPEAQSAPVELQHSLKLYHTPGEANAAASAPGGAPASQQPLGAGELGGLGGGPSKPVVRDRHDELVFVDAPQALRDLLASHVARPAPPGESLVATLGPHNEAEELWRIMAARRVVHEQGIRIRQQLTLLGGA